MAANVVVVGSDPGDSTRLDAKRLQARLWKSQALEQMAREAIARARATCDQTRQGRSRREILHDSAYARLLARQQTMAVIEQAKGIIMAQQRCGSEEAFDLLRRASQYANVKVHVLAAQIVEHVTSSNNGDNVTLIALGAARYRGSRTASPATYRA